MKKIVLSFCVSLMAGFAFSQSGFGETPYLVKSLAGENVNVVMAETVGGEILLESAADASTRIEVYVEYNNEGKAFKLSKEEKQARLDEFYTLKVSIENHKLIAIAKTKKNNMSWRNSLTISYKIFVAQKIITDLTTSGGDITIKSVEGEQKLSTSGGNLIIEKVKGKLKGVTSGGNIVLTDASDDMDLSTSGGNVEAMNCNGKINLSTSGGSLMMTHLNGNITAYTSGGNVKAEDIKGILSTGTSGGNVQLLEMACDLTAGTSGGNIKVEMKAVSKFIKLANSSGEIELQLPAGKGYNLNVSANKIKTENLNNFSGKVDDNEIEGTMNGGGTEVKVKGGSGRITLIFK
jgi:Putative adhesin